VFPQIYLGQTPATPHDRRALRERALDLRARLSTIRPSEPTYVLLNFAAGAAPAEREIELLMLRPAAVLVGAIREYRSPIEVAHGGRWAYRDTGEPIRDRYDQTPLQLVQAQRDAVRARLNGEAARVLGAMPDAQPFERTVGAVVCAPALDPGSRIALDVTEHRQWLKVLGLDELPGLAAMLRTGVQLSEESLRVIAGEVLGGRLWHDGEQFLFDLAPCRFQLRLLDADGRAGEALPLSEGENIVGRRRAPQHHEHRLALAGDDLVSSDHATIVCEEGDGVRLRDTSKNGTWVTRPGAAEERVRGERTIGPGTLVRMGVTRMRLERVEDDVKREA
jgi:hypothetical protein